MNKNTHSVFSKLRRRPIAWHLLQGLAIVGLTAILVQGCTNTDNGAAKPNPPATAPAPGQAFASPEEAVKTLITAVRDDDLDKLAALAGSGSEDVLSSGDPVADLQRRQKFLALYDQKHSLTDQCVDRKVLIVGDSDWPFPVPLVRQGEVWRFDVAAGREEILNRRIGENELSAIQVCRAIADAEAEYALRDPLGEGLHEYARHITSDPGKRNGLYWPVAEGEPPSPLGELVASASAEGYKKKESGPTPYHGYYYRILEGQGPSATDGAVDYVVNGRMTLGFAVVAYPAEYGNSGIMTFLMGPDGVVYQQNFGAETPKIASEMKTFDPDADWTKVDSGAAGASATAPATEPAKKK